MKLFDAIHKMQEKDIIRRKNRDGFIQLHGAIVHQTLNERAFCFQVEDFDANDWEIIHIELIFESSTDFIAKFRDEKRKHHDFSANDIGEAFTRGEKNTEFKFKTFIGCAKNYMPVLLFEAHNPIKNDLAPKPPGPHRPPGNGGPRQMG